MPDLGRSGVLSHWFKPFESFETSTSDFYDSVEAALERHEIPNLTTSQFYQSEGGPFAQSRKYLRVQRGELAFEICAAPFGSGYFFSWWLRRRPSRRWIAFAVAAFLWLGIAPRIHLPLVSTVLLQFLGAIVLGIVAFVLRREAGRVTYYIIDAMMAYQSFVQAAVNEAIDGLMKTKGLHALTEDEKKPVMRDFLRE